MNDSEMMQAMFLNDCPWILQTLVKEIDKIQSVKKSMYWSLKKVNKMLRYLSEQYPEIVEKAGCGNDVKNILSCLEKEFPELDHPEKW